MTAIQVHPSTQQTGAGYTHPVITTTMDGRSVVFKHNKEISAPLKPVDDIIDRVADERDIAEVLASHLLDHQFHLPTVTYDQAFHVDGQGQKHAGVISDFQAEFHPLTEADAHHLTNPDQAAAILVVRAWMGDWDCVYNDRNTLADHTPQGPAARAVDFGSALADGVTSVGLPDANRHLLAAVATPARLSPWLDKITALSDDQIRHMVNEEGRLHIENWSPQQLARYSGVLIRNRDRLIQQHPFDNPDSPLGENATRFLMTNDVANGVRYAVESGARRLQRLFR
ncbi:MAG TPA: hypothetical protein VGO93_30550 [Candidatus Xenobia bacterium]|jgi:hypothetical protein